MRSWPTSCLMLMIPLGWCRRVIKPLSTSIVLEGAKAFFNIIQTQCVVMASEITKEIYTHILSCAEIWGVAGVVKAVQYRIMIVRFKSQLLREPLNPLNYT